MLPLLLVMAAGAVIYTVIIYRRTSPLPGPEVARALLWLRGSALVCLVAAIGAPFIAMSRARSEPAELLVLVEDSGSMSIADAGGQNSDAPQSRWVRALDLCGMLEKVAGDLDAAVRPVFLRGNGFVEPREFHPDDAVIPAAESQGTDLDELRSKALKMRQGHRLGAVVLISDGCETPGRPSGGEAGLRHELSSLAGDRFFAVGVGDRTGPRDRLLTDVRYPKLVHRGDEVQVDCVVEQRFFQAMKNDSMTVTLRGPHGLLSMKRLAATGDVTAVSLDFVADSVGLQVLSLEVTPLDNERFPANNKVSLGISVGKEQARLLFLTTAPRWDTRFLAQAALREPRLVMDVVYPGPAGLVLADSMQTWQMPRTAEDWSLYDGVILEFGSFPESFWRTSGAALVTAVQKGMGLLVLPGPGSSQFQGGVVTAIPQDLESLLPVQPHRGSWRRGEFFLTPVAGVGGHPVLDGLAGSAPDISTGGGLKTGLAELPPQAGVIPVTVDAGAMVLLQGQSRDGSAWPMLVLGTNGLGRVAWFGGNALWESAFWEPTYQEHQQDQEQTGRRLLRNLLVWLGIGEQQRGLRIQGDVPLVKAGQTTQLVGIWQDLRGLPVREGQVVLQVKPESGGSEPGVVEPETQTFALGAPDPQTGRFPVSLPPLAPGRYLVTLLGKGSITTESQPVALVVEHSSVEDGQVRQDYHRLLQVAREGRGHYVAAADSAGISDMVVRLNNLSWQGRIQKLRSHYDLTEGVPFLALVTILLGLEWYLRRRNGLL